MVGDPEWLNSYMEGVSDILNSLLAGLACYSAPPPQTHKKISYMNKSVTYLEISMYYVLMNYTSYLPDHGFGKTHQ